MQIANTTVGNLQAGTQQKAKPKGHWFSGLSVQISWRLFHLWFPSLPSMILAFCVTPLVAYFFEPAPRESFVKRASRVQFLSVLALSLLWTIPEILTRLIPAPVAYAIPSFVFFSLLYYFRSAWPGIANSSWRWWLFWSLLLTAGQAWWAPYFAHT
jgi:hypothetical protein